jgi:hypothetical protein
VTARFVSHDAVLVTYAAERESGPRSLRSSLWLNGDDGWRVLFHQGTPV